MSHFINIRTRLSNPFLIGKSLDDLNMKWTSDLEKIKQFHNQKHSFNIIIHQPNSDDIILRWNKKYKEYALLIDLACWEKIYSIEAFVKQLTQRYFLHVLTQINKQNRNIELVKTINLREGSTRVFFKTVP